MASKGVAAKAGRRRGSLLPAFAMLALCGIGVGAGAAAHAWGAFGTAPADAASAPVAVPARDGAPRTGPMSRTVMLAILRTTLGAVGNAIDTGNYTVLRDVGAPGFRQANTPERLAEVFATQAKARLDLSGVMFTEPVMTIEPRIEATGMLRMAGYFPAGRSRYEFDLLYQPVDGRWRLFGISTGVAPAAGAAEAG